MPLLRPIAALLLIVLAACTIAPQPEPRPEFYVMRHLQKATGPDPGLTEEGRSNAGKLVILVDRRPPAAIYVSTTRRAAETAAPLAARFGLTPRTYDPSDTPALIAAATAESGTVLIVGHSNTVPEIVERLGGARPADLSDGDYGDVWRIYGPERRVDKLRIPAN